MHRCRCESCQIVSRNAEVYDKLHPPAPYQCITDNPGIQAVCLNPWVLKVLGISTYNSMEKMLLKDQNTRLIDM